MPSMAVNIPTRAIMPNAIMAIVRADLTLFDFIALKATLTFSPNRVNRVNYLPPPNIKQLRYCFSSISSKQKKNAVIENYFNFLVV